MPNEITGVDTIRALFVSAFPQHLTMKMLESPSVAVYVKDDMRNMYYELNDVRWGSSFAVTALLSSTSCLVPPTQEVSSGSGFSPVT